MNVWQGQTAYPQPFGAYQVGPNPGCAQGAAFAGAGWWGAPPAEAAAYAARQVPQGQMPMEESYVENILRMNLGKIATIYMTFENNSEWNAKVFRGRLEAAGRDHIIIVDPATGTRYLLLMLNLDYITFDEPLEYHYPFNGVQTGQ